MEIIVKIDKELADKLLRIVKADNTQEAVTKVIQQYIKGK